MRRLRVVRRDPRGHERSTWSRSTPPATAASTPSATCASGSPYAPGRPAAQGLHPRRGAPDHEGRLERAPEVARGAARLRHLHVRLDRSRQDFPPAILSRLQRFDVRRLTVAEIEGKLEPDPRGRRPDRRRRRRVHLIARLAAGGMRDAESMLDQLLSSAPDDRPRHGVRELLGLGRRRGGRRVRRTRSSTATRAAGIAPARSSSTSAVATSRSLLDQVVERAPRPSSSPAVADPRQRRVIAALAAVARRLAAIDPSRAGVGGLRLPARARPVRRRREPGRRRRSRPGRAARAVRSRRTPVPAKAPRPRARPAESRLPRRASHAEPTAPRRSARTPAPRSSRGRSAPRPTASRAPT